jgi:hypothetical protein
MNLEIDKRMNSAWPNSARGLALPARPKGQSGLDSKSRRGALGAPPGRSPSRRVGGGATVAGGSDGEAQRGPAEEHQ